MSKRSIFSLIVAICDCSSRASFVVMLAAMTGLETSHARPSAAFDGTKTYGTFCNVAKVNHNSARKRAKKAYLILAEQREVEEDFDWLGVGCEHDEFRNASVQRLRCCRSRSASDGS